MVNNDTRANRFLCVYLGCKLGLEEASDAVVVSFGERLWHVDWSVLIILSIVTKNYK